MVYYVNIFLSAHESLGWIWGLSGCRILARLHIESHICGQNGQTSSADVIIPRDFEELSGIPWRSSRKGRTDLVCLPG